MSYDYLYPDSIDLFVKDRIDQTAAERQTQTAKSILKRFVDQPGIILADEVGMGKTFVALAVAISVFLKEKTPVVIMIPPSLIKKWPNDFELFREACVIDEKLKNTLSCDTATRPEEFFKLLDDDITHRKSVIFLTHGALTRNMSDSWIKLAIIQRALYRRRNSEKVYKSLYSHAGRLVEMLYLEKKNNGVRIWELLLNNDPQKWKKLLLKNKFVNEPFDDPVPELFINELNKISSSELDNLKDFLFEKMPQRTSANVNERLSEIRFKLNSEARDIWKRCLHKIKLNLPLLIFDEAHHLKNSQTQLVTKLFHNPEAEEDAGFLTSQFERMLFLTATPFQLGHHELYRVLKRFETIHWGSNNAPPQGREKYELELDTLLKKLDDFQIAARKFDCSWGELSVEDLIVDGNSFQNVFEWWKYITNNEESISPNADRVFKDFITAKEKLMLVEGSLKNHIIRHLKPRKMSGKFAGVKRRNNLPGNMIKGEVNRRGDNPEGLDISKGSLLPFLLAARLTTIQQDRRPVFAEGLASSYEAFRNTRNERKKINAVQTTDSDDDADQILQVDDKITNWYLEQLDSSLNVSARSGDHHPKIKPTVDRAIELWGKGEKVLIFCHYIATGKALRKYISDAMKNEVRIKGSQLLNCKPEEVFDSLAKYAGKINDSDSRLGKKCLQIINDILSDPDFDELSEHRDAIISAVLRYMRTHSFLVRFASAGLDDANEAMVVKAFETTDNSGFSFKQMLISFFKFLKERKEDRDEYITALKSIQPGGIRVKDAILTEDDEDLTDDISSDILMANVRLCYGATKQEFRQKLMKTFNTPFFPDILITSSVMAEGVDLQLNCRHIIHHDLCWNPSTLEQRTGRIDRIGAKSEKCGQSIQVYLPYISETQDEKMYKVVTERERWFNILMGDNYKIDAITTDKYAQRIPLPAELAKELSFDLSVKDGNET